MLLLDRFAGGKGEGTHSSTMEGAEESDIQFAPGVPTGKLESCLYGLCARVSEVDSFSVFSRGQGCQLFGQGYLWFIIEVRSGHMEELLGLILDALNDSGMAMTGTADGNARCEIQKNVPVHVCDPKPLSFLYH
jgi:hypothetical protein